MGNNKLLTYNPIVTKTPPYPLKSSFVERQIRSINIAELSPSQLASFRMHIEFVAGNLENVDYGSVARLYAYELFSNGTLRRIIHQDWAEGTIHAVIAAHALTILNFISPPRP